MQRDPRTGIFEGRPMNHRLRRLLQIATVATFVIVFYYGIVFTGSLPYHWRVDGYNDLILHVCAFGLLTLLAVPATARPGLTVGTLVVFAVFIEVRQLVLPGRTASLIDLAASMVGILLALLALVVMSRLANTFSSRQKGRILDGIDETGRRPG